MTGLSRTSKVKLRKLIRWMDIFLFLNNFFSPNSPFSVLLLSVKLK